MVSELPGWLAYEDLLHRPSAVEAPAASANAPLDYPNGVGSEGCGWDAYPELLPRPEAVKKVERSVQVAVENTLNA